MKKSRSAPAAPPSKLKPDPEQFNRLLHQCCAMALADKSVNPLHAHFLSASNGCRLRCESFLLAQGIVVLELECHVGEQTNFTFSGWQSTPCLALLLQGNCAFEGRSMEAFLSLQKARCAFLVGDGGLFRVAPGERVKGVLIAFQKNSRLPDVSLDKQTLLQCAKAASQKGKLNKVFDQLVVLLNNDHQASHPTRLKKIARYYLLLHEFLKPLFSRQVKAGDSHLMEQVGAFLSENLAEVHSMKELSRRFKINEFRLKTEFKQVHGQPVFRYLFEKRMQYARRLLLLGSSNVTEVAMEVGYSNSGHFTQAFRRYYSMLPSDFLRRSKGQS